MTRRTDQNARQRSDLSEGQILQGKESMEIATELVGLMEAAVSLFGSGCTVELRFESTHEDDSRYWTCSVVDPDVDMERAWGFGDSAEVAIAGCSMRLEMWRHGVDPAAVDSSRMM